MARYLWHPANAILRAGTSASSLEIIIGLDIEGHDDDLSAHRLTRCHGMTEDELRSLGVTAFKTVTADDVQARQKLGLD